MIKPACFGATPSRSTSCHCEFRLDVRGGRLEQRQKPLRSNTMTTCRAAVITEHNKPLTIEQVQIPNLDPGSLLIKITASTLCGTDVHRWHGPLGGSDTLPIITGHEPCGTVEDIAGERTDILGDIFNRA